MNRVRINVIANFLGRFWAAALSLLLIPVYFRLVGRDGYGLIAFFATVQVIVNIFDLGASTTVSREMARFSADPEHAPHARSLVRTMEAAYWAIGVVLGVALAALAPFIARGMHTALSFGVVERALVIMAAVVALQWPLSFYGGATMGLQRQALWNAVNAAGLTWRGAGALVVLMVHPTITAFFYWQALASAMHTAAAMIAMWRVTPKAGERPRVRLALLRNIYRFALSVSGLSILVVLISQIDKLILTRTVTLAEFGEYGLATSVAAAISLCAVPFSDSFLPRLAQLAAAEDHVAMAAIYHRMCQLMALATAPVAAVLIVFSQLFLRTWTVNPALAARVSTILALLVAGQTLNLMISMLDVLQIAYGWLKPAVLTRAGAFVLMGPVMAFAVIRYGTYGAALCWLAIYFMYFAIAPSLVFGRLLRSEMGQWYGRDVLLPLGVALSVCALLRLFVPRPGGWLGGLFFLAGAGGTAALATAASIPAGKDLIRRVAAAAAHRGWTARSALTPP